MDKRLITVGVVILGAAIFIKIAFVLLSHVKIDEFHKTAITFIVDSSSANQSKMPAQIKYIKSLCAVLDPEDAIKIIKTDKTSYLIYEGSPGDGVAISNAMKKYTQNGSNQNSYGEAIKKAVDYSLTMKKNGYNASIVVIGNLEDNGDVSKRINWNTLPKNIEKTQKYLPELSMMFAFADPQKLDEVKTKLNPILGENKLILVNEVNLQKSNNKFIKAIGR
ncbi:hypothetical protein J6N69_03265 [bacterium]|nr:hypothetical protein [bacterium]MBP3847493.1 hypothetical protein [bacterium]